MKFRSSKPTEDPLSSKKEKCRMVLPLSLFLLQISKEFHFYLCFVFLGVAIRFYIYIYIYTSLYSYVLSTVLRIKILHTHTRIYIYTLSVHTRPLTTAWVCFFTLNFTPSQIIIAGIFWGAGTELLWTLFSFLLALFFFRHLRWPTNVNKEVYLIQRHS